MSHVYSQGVETDGWLCSLRLLPFPPFTETEKNQGQNSARKTPSPAAPRTASGALDTGTCAPWASAAPTSRALLPEERVASFFWARLVPEGVLQEQCTS